ncbi:hypothetical protein DPMN_103176 [Dreissena polymorpha]|uniref:PH domain-containing protein n=1 Tax=Dreissena polymorpha TaxID=45954 RepID=A0A9D4H5M7_DREPO|nr:hypothetical protein DPMN_103176 [Dreissena polymorpha]
MKPHLQLVVNTRRSSFPVENEEIKRGKLCIIQERRGEQNRLPVFVCVYRSFFDHYVIIYKDSKYSSKTGYINLRQCLICVCTGKGTQVRISSNSFDDGSCVFEFSNRDEADEWQMALQPQFPVTPTSPPVYPTVRDGL